MFHYKSLGKMIFSIERCRSLVRHLHLGDKLIRGPMENRDPTEQTATFKNHYQGFLIE